MRSTFRTRGDEVVPPRPTQPIRAAAARADRQRAARLLADLIARERTDLAVRPALTLRRPRIAWPWAGAPRVIRSLTTPTVRRSRPPTEECA